MIPFTFRDAHDRDLAVRALRAHAESRDAAARACPPNMADIRREFEREARRCGVMADALMYAEAE